MPEPPGVLFAPGDSERHRNIMEGKYVQSWIRYKKSAG
ncbi:hypothetical protein BN132_899 [Cronobacter turicensis 564]|nr:hypothetical protein BN132_899 [Cronobacter turicensis 564]